MFLYVFNVFVYFCMLFLMFLYISVCFYIFLYVFVCLCMFLYVFVHKFFQTLKVFVSSQPMYFISIFVFSWVY